MKYILYKYVDNDDKILYIGQTTQELKKRHSQHCSEKSIFKELKLFYTIVENQTQLNTLEALYISKFKPVLNKNLLFALPNDFVFSDNLVFTEYDYQKPKKDTEKINIKEKIKREKTYNFDCLSSPLYSISEKQNASIEQKRKIFSIKEFRIILLFYIKSKIEELPVQNISITSKEYYNFYDLNSIRRLKDENFSFLEKKGELVYLKEENISYLKDELLNETLNSLLKMGKFNSKYSFAVYFYLKQNYNCLDIEDFKSQYELPKSLEQTRDLKTTALLPAFQDLKLKVVEEITKGRKILKIIVINND